MAFATSARTEALARTLASLRGLTADEAVASALRAELERENRSADPEPLASEASTVEDLLARIRRMGPWRGPTSTDLCDELYGADGLPR